MTGLLSHINASSSFRVEFKLNFSVMHWPVASTENNRPSVLYSGIVIPLEATCCFSRSQSSLRSFQVRNDGGGLGGIINTVLLRQSFTAIWFISHSHPAR